VRKAKGKAGTVIQPDLIVIERRGEVKKKHLLDPRRVPAKLH